MMTPSIHLNGTSGERLLEDNLKAIRALQDAVEALQNAAPNGRDYYVQSSADYRVVWQQAYSAARSEHEARLHRLADNIHEINQICKCIIDQINAPPPWRTRSLNPCCRALTTRK